MPKTADYAYAGVDFLNVTAASGRGEHQIDQSAAPGVGGSILFDFGERGETYTLTLWEFHATNVEVQILNKLIKAINQPGPHQLKWRGRTFNALLANHSFGPYVRFGAGQRVDLILEFRTPSVFSDGRG